MACWYLLYKSFTSFDNQSDNYCNRNVLTISTAYYIHPIYI